MKTPEEIAEEFATDWHKDCDYPEWLFRSVKASTKTVFLAGYEAAKGQFADADKVITYDYVETASKDAEELIGKFELSGNKDMLVKALVAAYCRGVDAVDGHLRNSLSAYRTSVRRQRWISVNERLPEENEEILWYHAPTDEMAVGQRCNETPYFTHWQPLPEPPKDKE